MSETVEEKKVTKKGTGGCLKEIFSWIFWLAILPGAFYLYYNWDLHRATEARLTANQSVVQDLEQVTSRAKDLNAVEITTDKDQQAKALFEFSHQEIKNNSVSISTATMQMEAYQVGTNIYKIYNKPSEYIIGLPFAKWYHKNIIDPKLPEYSFLMVSPDSIEFCKATGDCNQIKKTDFFANENGRLTYLF